MDELPPWLVMMSENPVIAEVVQEITSNPHFRAAADSAFAGEGMPFVVRIGGMDFLEQVNATRRGSDRVQPSNEAGAVTMYGEHPDGSATSAGIIVDVDRLHKIAQDSAQARQLVRDALLHEFGHVLPVARSRSMKDRTFDPKPGAADAMDHPVIQNENRLRELLGLGPKRFYGLLDPDLR